MLKKRIFESLHDLRRKLAFLAWNLRDEAKLELLSDQSTFIADAASSPSTYSRPMWPSGTMRE